jgi:hypothetical protein
MDPGLIGGLLLPVLGALPDSAMIIMSGMGGTVAEAQEQVLHTPFHTSHHSKHNRTPPVICATAPSFALFTATRIRPSMQTGWMLSGPGPGIRGGVGWLTGGSGERQVVVGMGTLAGSTVMMLSIAWGGSLIVGRCDIDSYGKARDKKLTRWGRGEREREREEGVDSPRLTPLARIPSCGRGWGLLNTGVTSDEGTQVCVWVGSVKLVWLRRACVAEARKPCYNCQ